MQERVAAEAEFKSKYEVYFRLRQLIMANRQDFEALMSAVDAATTDAEKERSQEEVRRLWTRRGTRAKRWRAAFDVLHEELAGIKESLARYSEQAWPSSEGAASPPASHDS